MDSDEKKWIDDALQQCENATRKGSFLLLIRRQDLNDGADMVVTNATQAEMATVLAAALNGGKDDSSDE